MKAYKQVPGMEGAIYYYYGIPKNPINDWLVEEHEKRFGTPPDFFTAGGMAAALAIVKAIETSPDLKTDTLIKTMEGMTWDTPKGPMTFRKEDHQALQEMYHFKIKVDPKVEWAIPELVDVIKPDQMKIPVGRNNQE
jgi:branched-chain amino acid transport system substrate-binding protein